MMNWTPKQEGILALSIAAALPVVGVRFLPDALFVTAAVVWGIWYFHLHHRRQAGLGNGEEVRVTDK